MPAIISILVSYFIIFGMVKLVKNILEAQNEKLECELKMKKLQKKDKSHNSNDKKKGKKKKNNRRKKRRR